MLKWTYRLFNKYYRVAMLSTLIYDLWDLSLDKRKVRGLASCCGQDGSCTATPPQIHTDTYHLHNPFLYYRMIESWPPTYTTPRISNFQLNTRRKNFLLIFIHLLKKNIFLTQNHHYDNPICFEILKDKLICIIDIKRFIVKQIVETCLLHAAFHGSNGFYGIFYQVQVLL